MYPEGLRSLLNWVNTRYDKPKIYIFENGVSVPKENSKPIVEAVQDKFRIDYLRQHLDQLENAIFEDNINIRGYFAWSLMDNFEWGDGYSVRFGLVYIDYQNNQTRILKDSSKWYANLI